MNTTVKLSGIKIQHQNHTKLSAYKEEFDRKGFVVVKNVFKGDLVLKLQNAYNEAIVKNKNYYASHGLKMSKKEIGIIRQVYRYDDLFLETILKQEVKELVDNFIDDDWIITQQNGSHIDYENLSKDSVGVQVWHRDFVFRHITTSKPLLINILVPLDKFTKDSGATNILPYSHLFPEFPSNEFLEKNFTYAEADLGDIIVLNGLTYHSAGQNLGIKNRRSFNTVFAVPAIRHQVDPLPEDASEDFLRKFKNYLSGRYINNPKIMEFIKERNA